MSDRTDAESESAAFDELDLDDDSDFEEDFDLDDDDNPEFDRGDASSFDGEDDDA